MATLVVIWATRGRCRGAKRGAKRGAGRSKAGGKGEETELSEVEYLQAARAWRLVREGIG